MSFVNMPRSSIGALATSKALAIQLFPSENSTTLKSIPRFTNPLVSLYTLIPEAWPVGLVELIPLVTPVKEVDVFPDQLNSSLPMKPLTPDEGKEPVSPTLRVPAAADTEEVKDVAPMKD